MENSAKPRYFGILSDNDYKERKSKSFYTDPDCDIDHFYTFNCILNSGILWSTSLNKDLLESRDLICLN